MSPTFTKLDLAKIDEEIKKQYANQITQMVYITIPIRIKHRKGLTKRGLLQKIRAEMPIGGTFGGDFMADSNTGKPWKFAKAPRLS